MKKYYACAIISALAISPLGMNAWGASDYWKQGYNSNWSSFSSWSLNRVPNATDDAYVYSTNLSQNQMVFQNVGSTSVRSLTISASPNYTMNFYHGGIGTNDDLTCTNLTISNLTTSSSYGGTVNFIQNGKSVTAFGNLIIAYANNSVGSYTMNATIYNGNNPSLTTNTVIIGNGANSSGSFVQNAGTHNIQDTMFVGTQSSYTLNSGAYINAHAEFIGDYGTAVFEHNGGNNYLTWANTNSSYGNNLYLGHYGNGTYNLRSGSLWTQATEYIGTVSGSGVFNQTGGQNSIGNYTSTGQLQIANIADSTGVYNLTGGNFSANNGIVGNYGNGTFNQTSGNVNFQSDLSIGYNSLSMGSYILGGNGYASIGGNLIVGRAGRGNFSQSDSSTIIVSGTLQIARDSGSSGTYNLYSGTLTASNVTNNGVFNQTGGTGNLTNVTGNGTFLLSGGTLSLYGSSNSLNLLSFVFNGGTLQSTVNIITSTNMTVNTYGGTVSPTGSNTLTFSGKISGVGSLTKIESGTLYLSNTNNSYGGGTNIYRGTLKISSTIPATGNSVLGTDGLTIAGGTLQTTTTLTYNRSFNLGTGGGTLQAYAGTATYLGAITGTSLSISGSGVVVLNNSSSSYNGGTTINNGGTLQIAHPNAIGIDGVTVLNGGIFDLNGQSVDATHSLVLNGTGSASTGALTNSSTSNAASWSGPISLATATTVDGAGDTTLSGIVSGSTLTKSGSGTLTLTNSGNSYAGTTVTSGTLVATCPEALPANKALTITGSGYAKVQGSEGLVEVSSLNIGNNNALDLQGNDLIWHNGTVSTMLGWLASGRNSTGTDSTWSGNGIRSSGVAEHCGFGVMSGADYIAITGNTTFHNKTVLSNDVLLKYTWEGDANFDGKITMDDYLQLDTGYLFNGSGWIYGDFNHDGRIDSLDYAIIDGSFHAQTPGSIPWNKNGTLPGSQINNGNQPGNSTNPTNPPDPSIPPSNDYGLVFSWDFGNSDIKLEAIAVFDGSLFDMTPEELAALQESIQTQSQNDTSTNPTQLHSEMLADPVVPTPEPNTLTLLGIGAVGLLNKRRLRK